MVDVTQAMESQYITADVIENSPTKKLIILDEGLYEETEYGTRLTFQVEIDGKNKTWRPNKDSIKNISRELGLDSEVWVGAVIGLKVQTVLGKDSVIAVSAEKQKKISI